MCVWLRLCAPMCAGALVDQKRTLNLLEQELQMDVSPQVGAGRQTQSREHSYHCAVAAAPWLLWSVHCDRMSSKHSLRKALTWLMV